MCIQSRDGGESARASPAPPFDRASIRNVIPALCPNEAERAFLNHWQALLPQEKWGPYLTAWARGLAALGTPLTFVDPFRLESATLHVGSEDFVAVRIFSDSSRRHELMRVQKPIVLQSPLDSYRGLMDEACFLCQTVGLAQDGTPHGTPTGAILDLGDAFLVPNRYPMAPGHALFIPVAHDGARATLGRTPTTRELTSVMAVADGLDLIAMRNHVHDGMSIPAHDHFHLHPADLNILPLLHRIRAELGEIGWGLRAHVSEETPFQHLVLSAPTHEMLADGAFTVLESLDAKNEVYVLAYYRGCLLISHRHPDAGQGPKLTVGGAALGHAQNVTVDGGTVIPERRALERDLPRMPEHGDTPWFESLGEPMISPSLYQPLRWDTLLPMGRGGNLRPLLTELEFSVWDELLPLQDRRHDVGHAETVVLLTHLLAQREGLDSIDQRVARLAAIIHDAGWGKIPNITAEFLNLARMEQDASVSRQVFQEKDLALRIEHQQHAMAIARAMLAGRIDEVELHRIVAIVGDHDTRQGSVSGSACAVMWDADMLSRVTVPAAMSLRARFGPDTDIEPSLSRWAEPRHYLTAQARIMADEELQNTLRYLHRQPPYDYDPKEGPASWVRRH